MDVAAIINNNFIAYIQCTCQNINEAYEILYDDEKRKRYNIQRLFKNIEFTEEDHQLLDKYYQQFTYF